jgi:anti-sigma regulatory factor (Ser/Thr protein kinase)
MPSQQVREGTGRMRIQAVVPMTESSLVAEARRVAAHLSECHDFTTTERGHIALIVTELGTNLVRHAKNGRILLRMLDHEQGAAFEALAVDSGPGMADSVRSFRDGESTTGTLGTGLGAITRIATEWDFHTTVGKGTVFVARVRANRDAPAIRVGVVQQAQAGESECGDAWYVRAFPDGWLCAVADGLGHGPLAATASRAALEAIRQSGHATVSECIERAHEAAMPTRGAALGVASLSRSAASLTFAGVGNIAAVVLQRGERRGLISINGILGHNKRKLLEVTHHWNEKAVLVMHSDGLLTQWSLSEYPGLQARDPSVIAGVLFRDFNRNRDDVTVVVLKDEWNAWPAEAGEGKT